VILALGGGDRTGARPSEAEAFALAATGRPAPRVVFLPVGSRDSLDDAARAETTLTALGAAEVRPLFLTRNPSLRAVDEALAWADLVYLGGGSAPAIVKHGQRFGLADRLRTVLGRGGVVVGVSGGAIALGQGGCGAYNGYRPLPGFGLVPGAFLPHFRLGEEACLDSWWEAAGPGPLWGLEDTGALVWAGPGRWGRLGPVWALTPGLLPQAVPAWL